MNLVAIVGSAVNSGKTRTAVETAVGAAAELEQRINVDVVDLARQRVSILDGRSPEQYEDDTVDVIDRIKSGTMFLLASPVYRGSYTGAFKNLLDHIPSEAFEGKVVGLLATAATSHHYLAIDTQFRALLAWYNAYVLPGSVYLDNTAYSEGKLVDENAIAHLKEMGESLVIVSGKLQDTPPKPPSLTGQLTKARGG